MCEQVKDQGQGTADLSERFMSSFLSVTPIYIGLCFSAQFPQTPSAKTNANTTNTQNLFSHNERKAQRLGSCH